MLSGYIWTVPARIIRWKDGDTCEVTLDLGWRFDRNREPVRILNLFCPELDEPGGPEALAHATRLAPPGTVVVLTSKAIGRAGLWGGAQESLSRTLGDVRLLDGRDYAAVMVAAGYGRHEPGG